MSTGQNKNGNSHRRGFLLLASLSLASFPALGKSPYPSRVIKLVVPYAPGSGTDTVARVLAEALRRDCGAVIVVDNKPGANGTIGTEFVAKAQPDGYTLLVGGSSTHSSAPYLFKTLPYDPERDFEMIANIVESQFILVVRADSPARSVKELAAALRASEGKASFGYGSATTQIAAAAFLKRLSLTATAVPYKSNPPAITDLMAGVTDFMFLDQTIAIPQIRIGRLRGLAVAAPQRLTELPQVPTIAECGLPGFYLNTWLGILAPHGLPPGVAEVLRSAIDKVMSSPAVRTRLEASGRPLPPAARTSFPAYFRAQRESWAGKIKEAGLQPQ